MPRKCRVCGEQGHYWPTCGKATQEQKDILRKQSEGKKKARKPKGPGVVSDAPDSATAPAESAAADVVDLRPKIYVAVDLETTGMRDVNVR